MTRFLAMIAFWGAACSTDYGFAVDLRIDADRSIDDATLDGVTAAQLDVAGDEIYHHVYQLAGRKLMREERWVYQPLHATQLSFSVTLLDSQAAPLGFGRSSTVVLRQNATVSAQVIVSAGQTPDLGTDAAAVPDLATVDLATVDLTTVDLTHTCTVGGCAATNQGCSAVTGRCVSCSAPAANATDFYADAASFAAATGSQDCPVTTITAGLALANASSAAAKTLHVAAGTYTAGESFPLIVRNGISITGAGADSTLISGHGSFPGYTDVITMVIGSDGGGSNVLKGVRLQPDGIAVPTTGYVGILCDRGNAVDNTVTIPPAPNVTVDSCQVGPNYETGIFAAASSAPIASGCNLRVISTLITDDMRGVFSWGCQLAANVQLGDGTSAHANTFTNLHFSFGDGVGLLTYDCSWHIDVLKNTFQNSDGALLFTMSSTYPAVINIRDNLFTNLDQFGIIDGGPSHINDLSGNTFSGIGQGTPKPYSPLHRCALGLYGSAGVLSGLNNHFVGNEVGVEIIGNRITQAGADFRRIDFGEPSGSGGNTFSCNSAGAGGPGHDFWVHDLSGTSDSNILVWGNSWDHAQPTQDQGDGSDVPSPSPFPAGTLMIQFGNELAPAAACPPGKTP